MRSLRFASLSLFLVTLVLGCAQNRRTDSSPAINIAPVSDAMRQRLQRNQPDALIGRVISVLPQDRLAAVADIPVAGISVGDYIAFYGSEGHTIGDGAVIAVMADSLHVRYNEPQKAQRAPVVGDLAIRFKK